MSLATKYRPRDFESVIGQENIITILSNQVKNKDIRQAYLFVGGAGTGKTTVARILGSELKGEVIEIDAASNNGVDDVRRIREECKYRPISAEYKVYIVDEVHMLSTGAFNALLKTLEEPPTHAVFILATTDPHKIPATILSRCQRFDFKRIQDGKIQDRLNWIIQQENEARGLEHYRIGKDVYIYLSKLADGGMRDAISLLDTCLDYKQELSLEDIEEILGYSSYSEIIGLLNAVIDRDSKTIIETIENLHMAGKDLKQFIKRLTEFTVDLGKVAVLGGFEFTKIPPNYEEEVLEFLDVVKEEDIQLRELFGDFNNLLGQIKYENNPKVLIQGGLLSLC